MVKIIISDKQEKVGGHWRYYAGLGLALLGLMGVFSVGIAISRDSITAVAITPIIIGLVSLVIAGFILIERDTDSIPITITKAEAESKKLNRKFAITETGEQLIKKVGAFRRKFWVFAPDYYPLLKILSKSPSGFSAMELVESFKSHPNFTYELLSGACKEGYTKELIQPEEKAG